MGTKPFARTGGPTLKAVAGRSVLHVEDDDATALLVRLALKEADAELQCLRVANVDAALRLLPMKEATEDTAIPGLILLDLNLPRRSGFELLKLIRSAKHLEDLRVVIFTASSASSDRNQALTLGADDYVTKPSTFDGYVAELGAVVRSR